MAHDLIFNTATKTHGKEPRPRKTHIPTLLPLSVLTPSAQDDAKTTHHELLIALLEQPLHRGGRGECSCFVRTPALPTSGTSPPSNPPTCPETRPTSKFSPCARLVHAFGSGQRRPGPEVSTALCHFPAHFRVSDSACFLLCDATNCPENADLANLRSSELKGLKVLDVC